MRSSIQAPQTANCHNCVENIRKNRNPDDDFVRHGKDLYRCPACRRVYERVLVRPVESGKLVVDSMEYVEVNIP